MKVKAASTSSRKLADLLNLVILIPVNKRTGRENNFYKLIGFLQADG